jgi:hypothetical protein
MSTKKAKNSGVPADELALFDKLIAINPEIERKGRTMLMRRSTATCFC